jgi:hypothetical protein
MGTELSKNKPIIIKVKIWGRYRPCELRKINGDSTVDVRVMGGHVVGGMPSFFQYVSLNNVRKVDRYLCKRAS